MLAMILSSFQICRRSRVSESYLKCTLVLSEPQQTQYLEVSFVAGAYLTLMTGFNEFCLLGA